MPAAEKTGAPYRPRPQGQRGITLVETVAALGLFAISISAIGGFMVRQIRAASQNQLISVAYGLAAQELEDLRAQEYDQVTARSISVTKGNTAFTVETLVEADKPAANMKQVTVDVGWQDPEGSQSVRVQTIYTAVKR